MIEQIRLYWCLDLMCRVNTFLVFPDQLHSGQLKPSREDDAGALETEVEGKGSVADPAKLTFVSLEHLEKNYFAKESKLTLCGTFSHGLQGSSR